MNCDDSNPYPSGSAMDAEESSSDSELEHSAPSRRRKKKLYVVEDSDTGSDSSIEILHKRKRVGLVPSDSESLSTSGSDIVLKRRSVTQIPSDNESFSDWSTKSESSKKSEKKPLDDGTSSDASDGQSEKCPICLLTFKNQEVGSPESCDHSFCVECIQEWSKNVNTCPIDRQTYNLILVRSNLNGKIVRQIPIEAPNQQNILDDIIEDPTYCEICGSCEREDRMLLCDGCDLGFHLECLTPPLNDVPVGVWFCSDCGPEDVNQDLTIYLHEVELLLNDAEDLDRPMGPRQRHGGTRLVPRTRQSERVRRNILNHRTQARNQNREADIEIVAPGSSITPSTTRRIATRTSRPKKRKTRRKATKRKPRIKITYEIDEETGQEITIETIQRTRRRKKRKRKTKKITLARRAAKPKTVKKRLAAQLGMCAPRQVGQSLPDVKISGSNTNIGFQRSQAGIPTLHLFGRREQLDYFSDSESDIEQGGSTNILVRRRPNMSDSALMRRAANRKAIMLPTSSSTTTSCDLLGSILDSQAKFHSKNTVLSLGQDGTIQVDSKPNIFNNNNRVNLNDLSNVRIRQTPMYNNTTSNVNPNLNNSNEYRNSLNNVNTVTTSTSPNTDGGGNSNNDQDTPQDYSIQPTCTNTGDNDKKDEKSTNSESELDIYSDIETVSTSKVEESDLKPHSPIVQEPGVPIPSDDDANNSDVDLIIDTEKADEKSGTSTPNNEPENIEEAVTSTSIIDSSTNVSLSKPNGSDAPTSTSVIQSEKVQSSQDDKIEEDHIEDDVDSEDGCPNFSIYSTESMKIAKNTEVALLNPENNENNDSTINEEVSTSSLDVQIPKPKDQNVESTQEDVDLIQLSADEMENKSDTIENKKEEPKKKQKPKKKKKKTADLGLYSDSDDELVKIDLDKPFGISDIRNMTEDISEEERSYTPCLDERGPQREGLEGLEMEAISDEERNDFDESQELKTASDADALEINAKESELDFAKPDDYEEGEIIDKSIKAKKDNSNKTKEAEVFKEKENKEDKEQKKNNDRGNKESFKKISKSNKERNYRDKEREKDITKSPSRSKDRNKDNDRVRDKKKDRRKERRKEIERYNVRSVVNEKPRRAKDKFGRDIPGRRSNSRSSKSASPAYRRSASRGRRSFSPDKARKRRARSHPKSNSPSRSRSRKRTRSRIKKRQRSPSREKLKRRRKSRDSKTKKNKKRSVSRQRTRSPTPRRRRDWERRRSAQWSPSASRSRSPELQDIQSWTPPRLLEKQPVKPRNLTVILTNDSNKKKRDKKKKAEKKREAAALERQKKRRRDRTPPPSKEVFASGDNILVSVNFNKENYERETTLAQKRTRRDDDLLTKRTRKEKEKRIERPKRRRKTYDLSGIKPVAIIDLERSPFKEMTPSPRDIIVLSDSDTENAKTQCDSSQQAISPSANNYSMGPKTPPEPQVKFSLNAKQPQLRAISNPLHEPEEPEIDPQEELENRLNDSLHKGPNTPPDPPNSAPSSPDAYDPFDPTKSRSPTPELQPVSNTTQDTDIIEVIEIPSTTPRIQTPDALKSHTPPVVTDIQPADSQSNTNLNSAEAKKAPDVSQAIFPTISKPAAQTIYSSAPIVSSTPLLTFTAPRINILNSTILNQPTVMSSVPQRIVLPNTTKSGPTKAQSTKPPIKSTPIKPMPNKSITKIKRKNVNRSNDNDIALDFDSPYSPGSSDYEDLFDPPSEPIQKSKQKTKNVGKNHFDTLFGSSPKSNKKTKQVIKRRGNIKTKMVGVKIDEDSLKILDDVPNSAVEMQVKDKFLKKLNRQERVVEEVKLVLKPHYNKKHLTKEEYKDILRRSVPKICHNKSGEINPKKIQSLIEAYVKKCRQSKKVTSSSSVNK